MIASFSYIYAGVIGSVEELQGKVKTEGANLSIDLKKRDDTVE